MSKSENSHSVQGSWRGHYYYSHAPAEGHGFEAVFVEINGIIEGNILDDDYLGEAVVGGSFHYPNLQFTKVYRDTKHPIKYWGTMSEDGKELHGRWTIQGAATGTWRAVRADEGMELKFEFTEQSTATPGENFEPELVPARRKQRDRQAQP